MHPFLASFADELVKVGAAKPLASRLTPESSNVRGYSYDPASSSLTVTYKGGGTYRYDGVPPAAAKALGRNKSVGKTINKLVKGPGYTYEKIGAPSVYDFFTQSRRWMNKLAGVAKKQITVYGLTVKVEHEPGDIRSGTSKDGTTWERKMHASYGYVPGTKGMGDDGDAIDVYVAADPQDGPVYEIDQKKREGGHDEMKYMVGYETEAAAKADYLRHMPSWAFGSIKTIATDPSSFADRYRKEAA